MTKCNVPWGQKGYEEKAKKKSEVWNVVNGNVLMLVMTNLQQCKKSTVVKLGEVHIEILFLQYFCIPKTILKLKV